MSTAQVRNPHNEATNGAADHASSDAVVWNDWHPVSALEALDALVAAASSGGAPAQAATATTATRLLGVDLGVAVTRVVAAARASHRYRAWRLDTQAECHVQARYGVLWVCVGEPRRDLLAIPEAAEPDRRLLHAGAFRVHVSGLRAIENFLDMGHFPFVHTGYLGVEPYTEVAPYRVQRDELNDELYAYDCRFYQPRAAVTADAGLDVQYVYRVARPYSAILYKTCPPQPERFDVIALFVQPVDEDWCVAHTVMSYLDDASRDDELRGFQQTIFAQDIKILVNQVPKRLPLGTGAEHPVRADAMSVAYRRWLAAQRITYGTSHGR
ncbi:aromatic ring-hydroxylating oxygenase subunit alpha [Paraburkholderia fynbosensis]|uniref:Putative methylxanthine N7-demethylase NdmC n=1 Tax=Paraburkholderia fynbosensis TaxID=1200993 RepID=A0A6J5GBZ9_9BURK|nr:aromatic ring-hydroxylating dioxygenase subunit alpha [Paraburkholderia fynbosensis]CAB3795766.1 putative methylxanthine N7-demethylase NdmC [Paraburkholderia fynbosensis]